METVSLTIDGQQVTVEKGKTVLQAAIEAGISVPYYCFHPGLTVDGSCRVCIVKIEKMPKLQTSCSTVCTEGMVVTTRDAETTQARAGVLEFLLCAVSTAASAAPRVRVPIWLTLTRIELPVPSLMPSERRTTLVTNRSSPTSWHLLSDPVGERLPAIQVVFRHAVLNRHDRIACQPARQGTWPARPLSGSFPRLHKRRRRP